MQRIWILVFIFICGCATRYEAPAEYTDSLALSRGHNSRQTTVLFLVDGLSLQTLGPLLAKGQLPQIERHFLTQQGSRVYAAHTLFPSLTFPAISSLLHQAPVHETGALGNTLLYKGKITSFEAVNDREKFTAMMTGNTVFERLKQKGQRSVSLDYGLGPDATVSTSAIDIKVGLATGFEDYLYLDQKRLASMKLLLSENEPELWPEFIFIHLVGLDFLSHKFGSQSKEARQYLITLDDSLKEVLTLLKKGESKAHPVVSMLTADHGFSPRAKENVDVEGMLKKIDPELIVFNEHRMASVYSFEQPGALKLQRWTAELLRNPALEIVATSSGDEVSISSTKMKLKMKYVGGKICAFSSRMISVNGSSPFCPDQSAPELNALYHPFFIENMAYFFQAERHPDLIVIPTATATLNGKGGGYHGGPTKEEVLVPLLLRNATLSDPNKTPALWELLKYL